MDKTEETIQRVDQGELALSHLLRIGVVTSVAIILLGAIVLFATQGQTGYFEGGLQGLIAYPPRLNGAPVDRSISQVITGLKALEPDAIIALGLLLLIATPIMRVAVSVLLFLERRDYLFVVITLCVLTVLLIALSGGLAA